MKLKTAIVIALIGMLTQSVMWLCVFFEVIRERQNNCVSGITECKLTACRKGEYYADYTASLGRTTERLQNAG